MKAIDAIYRSRGYIYVFMNPENTEKPKHIVDVAVKITEGDQYRLGRIEFTGNKTTRDKVLSRELQVFEGDIMDMETFKKSLFKVTQLGYFKIEEDPDFRVNPEKKTVDVSIKGTDTNRNEVQFGAGYSQLDGLFGQFQFNTRNFLGRGDTLGRPVPARQPLELLRRLVRRAVVPRPADVDRRLDVQPDPGLQRRRRRPQPEEQGRERLARLRAGRLRRRVGLLRVHGPDEHVPGVSAAAAAGRRHRARSPSRRTSGKTSAVTPGYRYDSRNDPFDPSRGMKIGASISIAGGPFGGDFSYYKLSANATRYIPFGKKGNFAFNVDMGLLRAYSGVQDPEEIGSTAEIPLFERYRIGGDRSVRGFKYGSIYPLDAQERAFFTSTGALLGGDRFLVFNAEYVYTLAGPLKIALFFDAGNAWLEGQSRPLDRCAPRPESRCASSCRSSRRRCGSSTASTSQPKDIKDRRAP